LGFLGTIRVFQKEKNDMGLPWSLYLKVNLDYLRRQTPPQDKTQTASPDLVCSARQAREKIKGWFRSMVADRSTRLLSGREN
jgi:hypothetical protein